MQHVERVWNSCGEKFIRRHGRRSFLKTVSDLAGTCICKNHARSNANNLPRPKFWFNDLVICEWVCDDNLDPRIGSTFREYGVVNGLIYDYPEIKNSQWCYWVRWYAAEPREILIPGTSAIAEKDIELASKFSISVN